MRGSHIKLGEGERKVRLGQDSLPNKAEMSGDYIRGFTRTRRKMLLAVQKSFITLVTD